MPDIPAMTKSVDDLVAYGYPVKTKEYLKEGWRHFWRYPVGFLGFALIFTIASQGFPLLTPVFGQFLSVVVQVIMMAGIALVVWKLIRWNEAAFADFFPGWETLGQLVLCTMTGLVLVVAGLALFVVPGIYLLVAYTFSYALIVDRGLPVWQALETSRRVVTRNWWGVAGLTTTMLVLTFGGMVLFTLLLGLPFGIAMSAYYPPVNIADLLAEPPVWLTEMNVIVNLGLLIGLVSGGMLGLGVGTAVAGCMFGVAYADIFGLTQDRQSSADLRG